MQNPIVEVLVAPSKAPRGSKLTRKASKKPRKHLHRKFKSKPSGRRIQPRKKPKTKTLSKYKKELDSIFSKYIRTRDNNTCFTCGLVMEPNKSQNGHFIPRQYLSLRWNEENCHCQCYACNVLYNGQPGAYAIKLGHELVAHLESRRKEITKLNTAWYEEKIEEYTEKLKILT